MMELILGGINGNYLRGILESATEVDRVDAAVAYVSSDELLEWCWKNDIPITLWGRFDESVPVSIPILRTFLDRRSAKYVCKLVRHYHPKVIWLRGYGAYIGSANLTSSAWVTNIEAGVFIREEDMTTEVESQLHEFFQEIDAHAAPLGDLLFELLKNRNEDQEKRWKADAANRKKFEDTDLVPKWPGLSHLSSKTASARRRDTFLNEWNSTLQIIKDIGFKLASNRPAWVREGTPLGAQADQFLHAHYYQRTFDGKRADFERHFELNRRDPDAATDAAMKWWKALPSAPNHEDTTLEVVAPRLAMLLGPEKLPTLNRDELVELIGGIHASREYARRVKNYLVGLPDGTYSIAEKVAAIADRMVSKGATQGVLRTLNFVLYDGANDHVPQRLWEAANNPQYKIEMIGISALGEAVGWAMPNLYPPRNGRTSKALRSLGYDVKVHVGG
jgi:hypothetical protein